MSARRMDESEVERAVAGIPHSRLPDHLRKYEKWAKNCRASGQDIAADNHEMWARAVTARLEGCAPEAGTTALGSP